MNSPTSVYRGFQTGCGELPGFNLYNLLVDIPGHCAGSTVSAKTLLAAGLEVPDQIGRELAILLQERQSQEAASRFDAILETEELLDEVVATGITKLELEVASRELGRKGGGQFCYRTKLWKLIADELYNAPGGGFDTTADRILNTVNGIPSIKYARTKAPAMAEGNKATEFFKNTSRFPDAQIKSWIEFICEGRLPPKCRVVIEQARIGWGSGCAWGASLRSSYYGREARAQGGRVYVCAPGLDVEQKVLLKKAHKGYLERTYAGGVDRMFSVLAHEIRHVFQGTHPLSRECRRVRKHQLGTNGKLREVDACLFEIRALRRFRRDFPITSPKVLPLP